MTTLYDELSWRGLVYDATEGVAGGVCQGAGHRVHRLRSDRVEPARRQPARADGAGAPSAIRPFADRDRRRRHRPDRRSERQVAGARRCCRAEQIEQNLAGIKPQLARFLDFDAAANPARSSTMPTGSATIDLLGFLRDTGKYFTVNYLLQKESVNRRLESEDGISFTEFSYLLLQARDFLELFDRFGCTLQMGGSDQWGNITAGIDLIRKLRAKKAHGLVMPLVTTASGVKFGKTEAGAVWLDPARTSPFALLSVLVEHRRSRCPHLSEVLHVSRARGDCGARARRTLAAPEKREAARVLAREVTTLVHGSEEAAQGRARRGRRCFPAISRSMAAAELLSVLGDVPSTTVSARRARAARAAEVAGDDRPGAVRAAKRRA